MWGHYSSKYGMYCTCMISLCDLRTVYIKYYAIAWSIYLFTYKRMEKVISDTFWWKNVSQHVWIMWPVQCSAASRALTLVPIGSLVSYLPLFSMSMLQRDIAMERSWWPSLVLAQSPPCGVYLEFVSQMHKSSKIPPLGILYCSPAV